MQPHTALMYELYIKLTAFGYLFAIDVLHIKVFSSTRTHTHIERSSIHVLYIIYAPLPHTSPLSYVCVCKKSKTSTRPRPQTKRTHTITKVLHVRVSLMPVCLCEWVERSSLGGGGGVVRVRQQRNIVNRLQNKYENF